MINVFSCDRDDVIKSTVALGVTDYEFALEKLMPLTQRFEEQRKTQSKKFYSRLKKDIVSGCIMPPITLAFVSEPVDGEWSKHRIEEFVNENVSDGYILDGLQRLNTLREASEEPGFGGKRPLHTNIIIAERYDLLLYRMITLNNGQKPMTARHQIEMLTKGAVDLSKMSIPVVTEKETDGTKIHGAFKKSDVVEAYTAYLTASVNNQNAKIIESKLDEIIVGKVMESDLSESGVSFSDILYQVDVFGQNIEIRNWLRQVNNLIGFTVGAKKSLSALRVIDASEMAGIIEVFEHAFEAINPSKVNVGKFRRELSAYYIENIEEFRDADVSIVEAAFFERTLAE